ncbi:MAG: hypothetical protein ACOY0R_11780 [Chloroflexota bacterium]
MKTLRIGLPLGQTFFRAILAALAFGVALELLARTPAAASLPESYGSSHPHFETQMRQLKSRVAREGRIDCIFLGNSQVLYGIDPRVVEQTYQDATGQVIHCQNFGLGGLPPMSAAPVARMLVENFHPSVIVFGSGLWDYSSGNAASTHASLVSSPWVKYQLGIWSLDGWLYEHSRAFRILFGVERALKTRDDQGDKIDGNGHAAYTGQTRLTLNEQLEYFESISSRPELTERQRNGLRDLLALDGSQVKIILVETPFDPAFLAARRKARLLYPEFKNMLVSQAGLAGVEVWLTQEAVEISEDQWYDLIHLNDEGAAHFSRLLGAYLASVRAIPSR